MAFQNKPNSGALFTNKSKKEDKHPDYTGNINVEGKELQIAGWKKVSKNGTTFLSLSVSEKKEHTEKPKQDDLPF